MLEKRALEAMTEAEVLDAAGACADRVRDAETDLLKVAYQWAVTHNRDRLDPAEAALPGRERARMFGGAGTPEVCEFAAAELGARIGRSTYAAAALMADALDLRHRLPEHWARVEAGEVRASYARHVAAKTRDLSKDEAAYVDAAVAESADGRIPWTRFELLVEAKVAAAAPALAREKERKAAKATFARKIRGEAHGMGTFMVRADLATIDQLEHYVATTAAQLKESMPDADEDARRVHAMLLAANPGTTPDTDTADLLPTVTLHVHVYAGEAEYDPETGRQDRIARVEGHGPVTVAWVREVLGPRVKFRIEPVMDLPGQAPVDAYEIPDRHRRAVHLMTPADTFPYGANLSRTMQVDHTIPFEEGGQSGVGNYGPMTTTHHRVKTHAGWAVRQPFPGIYLWRDRHGTHYLVDHTGTRQLPATPPSTGERPPRQLPQGWTKQTYRGFGHLTGDAG